MALHLDITSQQAEVRLTAAAQLYGIGVAAVVERLAVEFLPAIETVPTEIDAENAAAIALLDQWLREDATDDPEEIRKSEDDLAEFKRNINANRLATDDHPVYP